MKKIKILFAVLMLFSVMAFSLAPVQVTIVNVTNREVALNYKTNGEWVNGLSRFRLIMKDRC